ncbi:hypothetical protein JW887_00910 [Candidatus Dojkabacteria bacterium]|nr:hypothetical protein [Candidatus Dojkabacteria bacterium]
MIIWHRLAFDHTRPIATELKDLGYQLKGTSGINYVMISESDPQWNAVNKLIEKYTPPHLIGTEFTRDEILEAKWLHMWGRWDHGYPMPDDDFGYVRHTYDCSWEENHSCFGAVQVNPFRIKGEPKWGKKHIMQLTWVNDVFFTQPAIWEEVFKPFGIDCMPVLKHSTGEELKTVVQLVPQITAPALADIDAYPHEQLERGTRYSYINNGPYPSLSATPDPSAHYMMSKEYFGSGGASNRLIIISSALREAIDNCKLKSVAFVPLKNQ